MKRKTTETKENNQDSSADENIHLNMCVSLPDGLLKMDQMLLSLN